MDLAANRNSRDKVGCGIIILATDGVWDYTSAKDLIDILSTNKFHLEPLVKKARDIVTLKEVDSNAGPDARLRSEKVFTALSNNICIRARDRGSLDDRTCLINLTAFPL